MERSLSRRRYLATGSTGIIAAIAGCNGLLQDDAESDDTEDAGDTEDDADENGADDTDDPPVEDVDHEDPEGSVSFVAPENGDEVTAPVEIEASVEDFELQPAEDDDEEGEGEPEDGAGHLHVIVDHGCVEPESVIPHDDGYHHLGDGEAETELELEPGEYELCLQAADDMHVAYDPTDEIEIEVVEGDGADGEDG